MFQTFIDEAEKICIEEYELDQKRCHVLPLLCDELDECKSRMDEVV